MSGKVLVLGATGATGKALIKKLKGTDFEVVAIARKPKPADFKGTWIQHEQVIPVPVVNPDHIMCCLGTTRKLAGSAENFVKIDHDLVIDLATAFHKQNPNATFSYVSSGAANSNSSFLYLQSKGKTENDLLKIGFQKCYIIRPAMLLYDEKRPDQRWAETLLIGLLSVLPFKHLFSAHVDKIAELQIKLAKELPSKVTYENSDIHNLTK